MRSVSNLQIVLPLIDENMARSRVASLAEPAHLDWRPLRCRASSCRWRSIDGVQCAGEIAGAQFPAASGAARRPPRRMRLRRRQSASLLKQLTEAMCRLMLRAGRLPGRCSRPMRGAEGENLPQSREERRHGACASHSRLYLQPDATRSLLRRERHPFGSAFRRVLQSNVRAEETAALMAVRSARYSSRPWCRRELSLFRRPLPETPAAHGAAVAVESRGGCGGDRRR